MSLGQGRPRFHLAIRLLAIAGVACFVRPSHAGCATDQFFGAALARSSGPSPHGIAVGDFNGDGFLDIAVACSEFASGPPAAGFIGVSLGSSTAPFSTLAFYQAGVNPFGVVTGDFNSDGIADLAVSNYGSSNVSILMGQGSGGHGNGTFGPPVQYPCGGDAFFVTTGDFNQDGITDLAVVNNSQGKVSVLLGRGVAGKGDGSFGPPTSYALGVGSQPATITTGDFNHDGIVDLAVTLYGVGKVAILLGHVAGGIGSGTFAPPVLFDAGPNTGGSSGVHPWDIRAGDFNRDGILDLVVAIRGDSSPLPLIAVLIGQGTGGVGSGTFASPVAYGSGISPLGLVSADFNLDGITDVAVTDGGSGGVDVLIGDGVGGIGNGRFLLSSTYTVGTVPVALAVADLDADGRLDLAVANYGSGDVSVLFGNCSTPELQPRPIGEWSENGIPLCAAAGEQRAPVGVSDGTGGAIIVWEDGREGGQFNIFGTRIGMDGTVAPGWGENGLPICTAPGDQLSPQITGDGTGGVIVGWIDSRSGGSELFLQHVLADGTFIPSWPPDGLHLSTAGSVSSLTMAPDGFGGTMIAVLDRLTDGHDQVDIYRMAGDGSMPPGWPAAGVTAAGESSTYSYGTPVIVTDRIGGGFVTWHQFVPGCLPPCTPGPGNRMMHVFVNGTTRMLNLNQASGDNAIASDGSGGVTLAINRAGSIDEIHFSEGGFATWSFNGPLSGAASHVSMAPDVDFGLCVWEDSRTSGTDIYSSMGGMGEDNLGSVVSNARGAQSRPRVVMDLVSGVSCAAWQDERNGDQDIYCTRLGSQGITEPGWQVNGNPVCMVPGDQDALEMVSDGVGGCILYWQDKRSGVSDVYAQRVVGPSTPTPTLISLVGADAAPGLARLTWFSPGGATVAATVYRREPASEWASIGSLRPDGNGRMLFEDHDALTGHRYGYRLEIRETDGERFSGETWVDIPTRFTLTLEGARPNPAAGPLMVSFTLASASPASLELIDVAGRHVDSQTLEASTPGRHLQQLGSRRRLAPGIYILRLTQDGRVLTARACIAR